MNCNVRADLPTPPLPTIITLCKPNCFSLAFDILAIYLPLEVVKIFQNMHLPNNLPSSEGSALHIEQPRLKCVCVTSRGVKSNHVTVVSCLFRVYLDIKEGASIRPKIPELSKQGQMLQQMLLNFQTANYSTKNSGNSGNSGWNIKWNGNS